MRLALLANAAALCALVVVMEITRRWIDGEQRRQRQWFTAEPWRG